MFSSKLSRSILGAGVVLSFAFGLFAPLTADAALLYRQLQLGMRGGDVSDLQAFLATDVTIYPQGLVTGYFGFLTKAAVSNFQVRNGIANVGRVGPQTMAAINAQMGGVSVLDKTAPTIGTVVISAINVGATFTWNTNENSSAIIYYSTSPISLIEASATSAVTVGGTSLLVHTDLRSTHSASLTGLSANTTYYYVVYVRDGAGNESITMQNTFKTAM